MAWLLLLVAGLLEVGWAIGLKYTEGFTRLWPSVGTLTAMAASVVLLGLAMKSLPVGTAYAVWVGVGAVGTAILGMVLFAEPATVGRLLSLGLIVAGIVGLKLSHKRVRGNPNASRQGMATPARALPSPGPKGEPQSGSTLRFKCSPGHQPGCALRLAWRRFGAHARRLDCLSPSERPQGRAGGPARPPRGF